MDGYLGEIKLFAGAYDPANWVSCDGRILPVNQFSGLFAILGVTYGGDGYSNFGMPDFRGRVPVCSGQGAGLTPRYIGMKGGYETMNLAAFTLPVHSHGVSGLSGTVTCNSLAASSDNPVGLQIGQSTGNAYNDTAGDKGMSHGNVALNGHLDSAGEGQLQVHENMQPSLCMRYIICVEGQWPPRS